MTRSVVKPNLVMGKQQNIGSRNAVSNILSKPTNSTLKAQSFRPTMSISEQSIKKISTQANLQHSKSNIASQMQNTLKSATANRFAALTNEAPKTNFQMTAEKQALRVSQPANMIAGQ